MPKRPGLQGPELAVHEFVGDWVVSEVQWKEGVKKDARKGSYIIRSIVASEVFELFPGLRLPVAVAEGIHPTTDAPGIETMWQQSWEEAARTASDYRSPQSHPRVAPWRGAMSAMGVSGRRFPSSIEALLRRAFKGGEPKLLVDFYNAISLRHVVPAGGFDLEEVDGALELRLTRLGDTFQPLDSSSEVSVEPGEVAYASGNEILTRYFVWKQSRKALLDESTRSLLLVSEVLGEVESGSCVADAVLEDFADGLRRYFNSEPAVFLLGEENPEVSVAATRLPSCGGTAPPGETATLSEKRSRPATLPRASAPHRTPRSVVSFVRMRTVPGYSKSSNHLGGAGSRQMIKSHLMGPSVMHAVRCIHVSQHLPSTKVGA